MNATKANGHPIEVPKPRFNSLKTPVNLPNMGYYHGQIDREKSERLLENKKEGMFLIRESHNYQGHFTLSLCCSEGIQHYRIIYEKGIYTIDENIKFDSLCDLVEHYASDADGLAHNLVDYVTCQTTIFPPVIRLFEKNNWFININSIMFEEKIGSGEFASVFKATIGHRKVAAKQIKKLSSLSYEGLKEAAFMTTLNHERLITFHGVSEDNDYVYLISEYLPNGCLLDHLRTLDPQQIHNAELTSLAIDIASGMKYIASKNVVHRDLAARNILLDKDHRAKISDFGLCRDVRTSDKSGRFPIKWTAPESIESKKFSLKSDVWSFGVLLWEIFSLGRQPYVGIPVKDVYSYLINENYRLQRPENCSEKIYKLMLKCWDVNPDQRPNFDQIRGFLEDVVRETQRANQTLKTNFDFPQPLIVHHRSPKNGFED